MLRSLNVPWSCSPLGYYRHSTLHWNTLSPLLLFLQVLAEMSPPLGSLPRCSQVALTTPSSFPVHVPRISPMTLYCLYLLMCFCSTRPMRDLHFIHFKFHTFIGADKVVRDLASAQLSTLSVPVSALPTSPSHTGLQTGPKIIKLLPVLGLCSHIDLFLEWPPLDLSMAVSLLTFKSLLKCHLLKNHLANQSKVIFLPPILSYIPYFLPFVAFIVNSL